MFSINNDQSLTIRGYQNTRSFGLARIPVSTDLSEVSWSSDVDWVEIQPATFGSMTTQLAVLSYVKNRSHHLI